MEQINQFLTRQRKQTTKIHCVGDAMIDEYYDVKVERISPEAPVPILHSTSPVPETMPGGVANVAYQYRHMNVDSKLICCSNFYSQGIFNRCNLNHTSSKNHNINLPIKKRFLENGVQIHRWDIEKKYRMYIDHQQELIGQIQELPDAAILSDYNKGFFVPGFAQQWLQKYKNCYTFVDPKNGPLDQWKGCYVFKPNKKEAEILSQGIIDPKEQCDYFRKQLNCHSVIITHGGDGVCGNVNGEYFEYNSSSKVQLPESVIGAGDCFSAFFVQAIALGMEVIDACIVGFEAGAVYVRNRMNRPIVAAELSQDGIISAEDLRYRDFKLVFTNGCFDLIHRGHLETLRFAKQQGEKLVVALNSDDSIRRLKGEDRPIKSLVEREAVMAAFDFVDFVISFEEDTPYEAIKKCMPDILVKGSDYELKDIVGADLVKEVIRSPIFGNLSTTGLLTRSIGVGTGKS